MRVVFPIASQHAKGPARLGDIGFGMGLAVVIAGLMACDEKVEVLTSSKGPTAGGTTATGTTAGAGDAASVVPPPMLPVVCVAPVGPQDVTQPTTVVGVGSADSCTEAALTDAIARAGTIVFRCGAVPVSIGITSEKTIVVGDTVIDGGGLVTLSGGGKSRILALRAGGNATGPRLSLQNLTLEQGLAPSAPSASAPGTAGGAIFQDGGTIVAYNSVFRSNRCAAIATDVDGVGGAIGGNGDLVIVGSVFESNDAPAGGAIGTRGGNLTIVNSRLSGNTASGTGPAGTGGGLSINAAVGTITICGSVVSRNSAKTFGGGTYISLVAGGPVTIDRSTFDANISDDPNNISSDATAGGIYVQGVTLELTNSTISNNQAGLLGGLWVRGFPPPEAAGVANLTNVTIANNSAFTTGLGGGLWIDTDTTGHLLNCTIAGNRGPFGAGIVGFGAITIDNSIIANTAFDSSNPTNCYDVNGPSAAMAQGGHNVQWPATYDKGADPACTQAATYADPMLAPLGDHGGPTATMVPMALGAVDAMGTACPPTDQRGVTRKMPCTLGAYENN